MFPSSWTFPLSDFLQSDTQKKLFAQKRRFTRDHIASHHGVSQKPLEIFTQWVTHSRTLWNQWFSAHRCVCQHASLDANASPPKRDINYEDRCSEAGQQVVIPTINTSSLNPLPLQGSSQETTLDIHLHEQGTDNWLHLEGQCPISFMGEFITLRSPC